MRHIIYVEPKAASWASLIEHSAVAAILIGLTVGFCLQANWGVALLPGVMLAIFTRNWVASIRSLVQGESVTEEDGRCTIHTYGRQYTFLSEEIEGMTSVHVSWMFRERHSAVRIRGGTIVPLPYGCRHTLDLCRGSHPNRQR